MRPSTLSSCSTCVWGYLSECYLPEVAKNQLECLIPIDHWNFYMAFCCSRLAAIVQGIRKRIEIGTASGAAAESRANLVRPLAEGRHALIE